MKVWARFAIWAWPLAVLPVGYLDAAEGVHDRIEEALTWSGADGQQRARLSGTFDLEYTHTQVPAPGLLPIDEADLVIPRLTAYVDAQSGSHLYFFAQARADRGFDAEAAGARFRLDEYALRLTPWVERRFSVQVGKFGTVVGNWVARHESWPNPFISAPLPYENLTGIWDNEAIRSSGVLLQWSHVRPGLPEFIVRQEKNFRIPIIWGPSYALGAAVAGELGRMRFAFEVKNAPLSSRPGAWDDTGDQWRHPTASARIGYRFNQLWNLGFSASFGSYLRDELRAPLPIGRGIGDYRQVVLAQDVAFAWHRVQIWSEFFFSRFEVPGIGNADTWAYYLEAKYKFSARFFGSVRWNEQRFGRVLDRGSPLRWGQDTWRAEVAPAFRVSAHTQFKLQATLLPGNASERFATMFGTQFTTRF